MVIAQLTVFPLGKKGGGNERSDDFLRKAMLAN